MKSTDFKIVASFLTERLDEFADFLEDEYDIDGSTEAGVIVENVEVAGDVLLMMEQQADCAQQGVIRAAEIIDIIKAETSGEGLEALMVLPAGRFDFLHKELGCG